LNATAGLVLALVTVLFVHLIEEMRTGFRKRLPAGEMPLPAFVTINVILYSYCFATFSLAFTGSSLAPPFTWVFASIMLVNGLGHIAIMIVRRHYFPGGISAFILAPLAVSLMVHLGLA
jgi:hypothetical protein